MIEAIGIGVVSNTVFDGLKDGLSKAQEVLTREEYEREADAITAAITTAVKESVITELVSDTGMTESHLVDEWDWAAIAAELDALAVWSQDRQTAIAHLTNAIEAGLNLEFDVDSTQRTTLEVAVTTGYRHAVQEFIEEITGTPLAGELALRTDRELLAIADTIEERLTALEQELRGTRAALQNQGFDRLDSLYFERHEPGDPETAWRTGFSLAAVAEGYPLPRERSVSSDGERESLTEEVYEQLTAGEHVVVVGETGSGKSTVCKQVACQWHAETDRGAVLYRRSASTTTFDEPGTLIEAIRSDEDDLLVVVEDAPRADANTIFEVLDTLGESEEVAVLLDARTGTWESDSPMGGQTCGTRRHRDVQDYTHRGQRANRQPCEAHTAGLRAHRLPYDRGDSTALYTCVRRRYTTGALPDGQNRS
ncbi:ATP-binding protein [Halocatena marina]|uniref:ATP-binding protein n=1 Tax=Halocatena marina TaxID=2934937 RepID=UPI0022250137|nr:ATP-binding protein [Halocatena marina]